MNTKKLPLAFWIFVGLVVRHRGRSGPDGHSRGVDFAKTYVKPFGTIFLNLIKFIVVPIVLFSITAGIISMGDIKKAGLGGRKDHRLLHVHHRRSGDHRPGAGQPVQGLLPAPG